MKFATLYGLCYGDELALHERFINSLARFVPGDEVDIVLWCNQLGARSRAVVERLKDAHIILSDENIPKYRAMRKMFYEGHSPDTPWVIWFDDDSYISKSNWWDITTKYINEHPDACYLGQPWFVHHLPGQWEFIQKATWFKGRPAELCPTRKKGVKKPGITFAQGAYWWLSAAVMKALDWPDPRLNHNGGDTLLGEAIRQQQLPFHKFHDGVKINAGKRRGYTERPAGSTVDIRR